MPDSRRKFEPNEVKSEILSSGLGASEQQEIVKAIIAAVRQLSPLKAIEFAREHRNVIELYTQVTEPKFSKHSVEVDIEIYRTWKVFYQGNDINDLYRRFPDKNFSSDKYGQYYSQEREVFRAIPKKELPLTDADSAIMEGATLERRWFDQKCEELRNKILEIQDAPARELSDRLRKEVDRINYLSHLATEELVKLPISRLAGYGIGYSGTLGELTEENLKNKLAGFKKMMLSLDAEITSWLPPPAAPEQKPALPAQGRTSTHPYR